MWSELRPSSPKRLSSEDTKEARTPERKVGPIEVDRSPSIFGERLNELEEIAAHVTEIVRRTPKRLSNARLAAQKEALQAASLVSPKRFQRDAFARWSQLTTKPKSLGDIEHQVDEALAQVRGKLHSEDDEEEAFLATMDSMDLEFQRVSAELAALKE